MTTSKTTEKKQDEEVTDGDEVYEPDGIQDIDDVEANEADGDDVDGVAEELVEEESGPARGSLPVANFTEGDLDATRLYLGEIGFSPLLTAEEEVYYSRRALRGDEQARKRPNVQCIRTACTATLPARAWAWHSISCSRSEP